MPANKKYLNASPWHQGAKISAGILGGFIITALFHMALVLWFPGHLNILVTSIFTFFIVWGALLIIPFLFKNGFKAWALYLALIMLFYMMYYFGNQQNPFV